MFKRLCRQQSERRAHAGPAALRQPASQPACLPTCRPRRAGALFSQLLVACGCWSGSARSGRHPLTPRCGTTTRPGAGHREGDGSARPGTSRRRRRWGREHRNGEPGALRLAAGLMTRGSAGCPGSSAAAARPPRRSCRARLATHFSPPAAAAGPERRVQRTPSRASQIRGKSEKFQLLQCSGLPGWHCDRVNL